MSTVAAAAERFAAGELVLVGDDCDESIFIAAAADRITSQGLADLQELCRSTVVLGMTESTVERLRLRLRLHGPAGPPLGGEGLRMIAPIDAASRAGHVLTAQIEEHGHGAAAAVVELARIAGSASTVALSAVLDARGGGATGRCRVGHRAAASDRRRGFRARGGGARTPRRCRRTQPA